MTKALEQEVDAVALVRRIRDSQAEQIQGMTTQEQIAYYQVLAQDLLRKLQIFRPVAPSERPPSAADPV
jgi:hypothetical protein